ncbi:MAG: hypothetical protein HRU46_00145 [Verrucomicrobiales bacterium]|nr:hypothetical protein [Verrucomicrobiales bacterium]
MTKIEVNLEEGNLRDNMLARLSWALAPVENYELVLAGCENPGEVSLPGEFDEAVGPLLESMLQKAQWRSRPFSGIEPGHLRVQQEGDDDPWDENISSSFRNEGSKLCLLSSRIRAVELPRLRQRSGNRFRDWVEDWKRDYSKAAVIATGPSFDWYSEFDFGDQFVVTCNSAIVNREMMEQVQPELVVFADPIFHFGPSQYAGKFRASLLEAASEFEFKIAIPEMYAFLFLASFPEFENRTIFLPSRPDLPEFNLDLCGDFIVRTTKNILTYLMLPLAGSVAKEIKVLGCDGRALKEDSYFWGHSQSAQITDKMANIQAVHPGFFEIDYNEYYLEHCGMLEQLLRDGEIGGSRFYSVTPSKIPALGHRAVSDELAATVDDDIVEALSEGGYSKLKQEAARLEVRGEKIGLISVNPSLKNGVGHALYQDLSMKQAIEVSGKGFVSIGQSDLIDELKGDFILPSFTSTMFEIVRSDESRQHVLAAQFVDELLISLKLLSDVADTSEAVVFLYLGHSSILALLRARLATFRAPFGKIVVNLFSGYFDLSDKKSEILDLVNAGLLSSFVQDEERIEVTVDSVMLRDVLARRTGVALDVLPMAPSQTFESSQSPSKEGAPIRVVFPSQAESIRGFDLLKRFIDRRASEYEGKIDFIIRQRAPWDWKYVKPFRDRKNVKWIVGDLSEDEYIDLIVSGEVILLPYSPEGFRLRTSSILAEAWSLGTPVVVANHTWLAHQVVEVGAGWIASQMTVDALAAALDEMIRDRDLIPTMCDTDRLRAWLDENSIENFVSKVVGSRCELSCPDVMKVSASLTEVEKLESLELDWKTRLWEKARQKKSLVPYPIRRVMRWMFWTCLSTGRKIYRAVKR